MTNEGLDIKWVPAIDPFMADEDILKSARSENRVLLTNDKDFGELIFYQRRLTSGVILIRIKGQEVAPKINLLKKLFKEHIGRLSGHFVVINKDKFRFLSLEVRK
ncbi:MAG: DUF5615 family PIN-like protein [Nitrospirae bacterium]|nr:DUF5615 family PIN-like protein [Nitrospirota bacterium]